MNPDTKLTTEQLKAICTRHHIPYLYHERMTTGFSHEVHKLNDNLIIKLFNSKDVSKFRTESALLNSTLPFLKPKLIAASEKLEDVDRNYVIMTYIPGISLGSCWHLANDAQRENIIKDVCQSLKVINRINPDHIALKETTSWQNTIEKNSLELVDTLTNKKIINTEQAEKILQHIYKYLPMFKNDKLYPTYWDVHFDNFIVNEDFVLQALIDLEDVELTTLDYPLFVIQKQTDEPEKYLRAEDEKYADVKDYQHLRNWYQKYYHEMFAFNHTNERIKVYQLLDTLHLLQDWSQVKSLHEKLKVLIV
jgi:hypothetical protein